MFDKQYRFKGRHAVRVDQLTSAFDTVSKAKLFDRNVDVYTNAPLVEPDKEARINEAFRHMGEDPADEERFDSYVRGGVDVLYEKLIEGANSPDDFVTKLFEFLAEFDERFNSSVSSDDILSH